MKQFEKGLFYTDEKNSFEGFTDGEILNGWQCPLFEKAEAEKLLILSLEDGIDNYSYSQTDDTFHVWIGDTYKTYQGYDITVNDEQVHVYPIGSPIWEWEKE